MGNGISITPQTSPGRLIVFRDRENVTIDIHFRRIKNMRTTFMAKGHEVERKWLVVV